MIIFFQTNDSNMKPIWVGIAEFQLDAELVEDPPQLSRTVEYRLALSLRDSTGVGEGVSIFFAASCLSRAILLFLIRNRARQRRNCRTLFSIFSILVAIKCKTRAVEEVKWIRCDVIILPRCRFCRVIFLKKRWLTKTVPLPIYPC